MDEFAGQTGTPDKRWVKVLGLGRPEFGDYAGFYWRAGWSLVDDGLAGRAPLDRLLFPILYLYRHALELALKDANLWTESAISAAGSLGRIDRTHVKRVEAVRGELVGHRLIPLLARLETRIRLTEASDGLDIDLVRPAVQTLDEFDLDGQRFRYPYLSKGEASWTQEGDGARYIDVMRVREDLDAALECLLVDLASRFESFLELTFEDEWIAELWKAEQEARAVEGLWDDWAGSHLAIPDAPRDEWDGYEYREELKADRSAEMLHDGDDP